MFPHGGGFWKREVKGPLTGGFGHKDQMDQLFPDSRLVTQQSLNYDWILIIQITFLLDLNIYDLIEWRCSLSMVDGPNIENLIIRIELSYIKLSHSRINVCRIRIVDLVKWIFLKKYFRMFSDHDQQESYNFLILWN